MNKILNIILVIIFSSMTYGLSAQSIKAYIKEAKLCYDNNEADCFKITDKIVQLGDWKGAYYSSLIKSMSESKGINKNNRYLRSNSIDEITKFLHDKMKLFNPSELSIVLDNQFIELRNRIKTGGSLVNYDRNTRKESPMTRDKSGEQLEKYIRSCGVVFRLSEIFEINIPYERCSFTHNGEVIRETNIQDNMIVQKNQYLPFIYKCSNVDISLIENVQEVILDKFPVTYKNPVVDYNKLHEGQYNSDDQEIRIVPYVGGTSFDGFKYIIAKSLENLSKSSLSGNSSLLNPSSNRCIQKEEAYQDETFLTKDKNGNSILVDVFKVSCINGSIQYYYNLDSDKILGLWNGHISKGFRKFDNNFNLRSSNDLGLLSTNKTEALANLCSCN